MKLQQTCKGEARLSVLSTDKMNILLERGGKVLYRSHQEDACLFTINKMEKSNTTINTTESTHTLQLQHDITIMARRWVIKIVKIHLTAQEIKEQQQRKQQTETNRSWENCEQSQCSSHHNDHNHKKLRNQPLKIGTRNSQCSSFQKYSKVPDARNIDTPSHTIEEKWTSAETAMETKIIYTVSVHMPTSTQIGGPVQNDDAN